MSDPDLAITQRTPISGAVVTQALKNLYATNNFEPNATTTCEIIGGKSVARCSPSRSDGSARP